MPRRRYRGPVAISTARRLRWPATRFRCSGSRTASAPLAAGGEKGLDVAGGASDPRLGGPGPVAWWWACSAPSRVDAAGVGGVVVGLVLLARWVWDRVARWRARRRPA